MSIQLTDNAGETLGVGVTTSHELRTQLSQDETESGFASLSAESNPSDQGAARRNRALEVSADYRLRVGTDAPLFRDNFSHTTINTSKYKVVNTTMTNALSGGKWVLNSGASTGSGVATQFQTWATFPLFLTGSVYVDFEATITQQPAANNVCEMGLFQCSGATSPLDGVMFRLNAAGAWLGVINNASAETQVALVSTAPTAWSLTPGEMHHFKIGIHNDVVDFWIDDILTGSITTPAALGSPFLTMSAPLTCRIYNSGVVAGTGQQLAISNVSVSTGDMDNSRLWPTVQAIAGNSAIQAPDGQTPGQMGNMALSTAPVTVAAASQLSTIACYTTLGGQFALGTIASAETEILVFDYTVPANTAAIPGKNLIIRGVTIDAFNDGAVGSALAVVQQWFIGVGGTTSTFAAVDSATAGTKAFRKHNLGFIVLPASAAIGAQCSNPIDCNLDAPIVCEPGCHVAIGMKPIRGPSNAGQVTRGICQINGYFE